MGALWEMVQQHHIFWLIIVCVILLLIGLVYRTQQRVHRIVRNEIYEHFPSIKKKLEEYEIILHQLELRTMECERRIRDMGRK